jgi:uncharacterized membrane protein YcaP (DUF421 family)
MTLARAGRLGGSDVIDHTMFFNGWPELVRVLVLGSIGYGALIVMLRVARKRTLAQMNTFDFVYVVVMGELLAMTIMDEHISLAKGLFALGLLISLQAIVSWLTTRSAAVERLVNGEPTLLMRRGRFLRDAMHAQRVTEDEILSAVREEGVEDLEEVEAVVLETNGAFSVVHDATPAKSSSLRDVPGVEHDEARSDERSARHPERREPAVR